MSIYRLTRIAELKHFSEYSIADVVTSFGLYQKALINLKDIRIPENDDDGYVLVSKDIERLNELLSSTNSIMLPCADCGKEQAFVPRKWGNPEKLEGTTPEYKKPQKTMMVPFVNPLMEDATQTTKRSVFQISAPNYRLGDNKLNKWTTNDKERVKQADVYNEYIGRCVSECRDVLLAYAGEVRKDFICSYKGHGAFVQFRIFDPIEPEDYEESCNIITSEKEEDKKAYDAFNYLRDCVVIQKVGQYPSIADMQLFDISKYRKILGKESYRDFTKAIGLYADGIGCGSFLYLRRIFERLIEEKHQACATTEAGAWDEEQYNKLRVNERIEILEEKGYRIIPNDLAEFKESLYGVLSKGVHESTDETCAEIFPALKYIIENILDEQIRQKEKEEKLKEIRGKLRQMQL